MANYPVIFIVFSRNVITLLNIPAYPSIQKIYVFYIVGFELQLFVIYFNYFAIAANNTIKTHTATP